MKKNLAIVLVVLCGCIIFTAGGCSKNSSNDETSSVKADSTIKTDSTANTDSTDKTANASVKAEGGNMEISVGSVSGEPGSTVTLPINIKTLPKKGVGSCNFNIKYDTKVLEAVDVKPGNIIANAANIDFSIIDVTGMINFLFTSNNNGKNSIEKTGEFLQVEFKIKKDAKQGSTVVDRGTAGTFGDTALNKINVKFSGGNITVK